MLSSADHDPTRPGLNPARERLLSKLFSLEKTLELLRTRPLTRDQTALVEVCQDYLKLARQYLHPAAWPWKWLSTRPLKSRHPHLIWELLHRVDEYLLLLCPVEELPGRAVEIKIYFALNITEAELRTEWLGEKGCFSKILTEIPLHRNLQENRYLLREALKMINDQVDRRYWQLSMNTLTSVVSGMLLGLLLLAAWFAEPARQLARLPLGLERGTFATLLLLGLIGSYAANLLTRDDFLYIRGAPFWRYLLHHLLAKPLLSAFAAVFIYLLERSQLFLAIVPTGETAGSGVNAALVTLRVSAASLGYTYALLALVAGFAADKVLRLMIDQVLKKLEQQAEKQKASQ